MYLYRMSNSLSSDQARNRFDYVLSKIGRVYEIRGYRVRSTRGGRNETKWSNTHERVMLYGEKGQARIEGVLWGYSGGGPCALVELLRKIGLFKLLAQEIAFYTPRLDVEGTDWTVYLPAFFLDNEQTILVKTPTGTKSLKVVQTAALTREPCKAAA